MGLVVDRPADARPSRAQERLLAARRHGDRRRPGGQGGTRPAAAREHAQDTRGVDPHPRGRRHALLHRYRSGRQCRRHARGDPAGAHLHRPALFGALLMASGNDAAYVLARAGGGMEATVAAMNEEARHLGAHDTVAKDPSGSMRRARPRAPTTGPHRTRRDASCRSSAPTSRPSRWPSPAAGRAGRRPTYVISNHNRLLYNYGNGRDQERLHQRRQAHLHLRCHPRGQDVPHRDARPDPAGAPGGDVRLGVPYGDRLAPVGRLVEPGTVTQPPALPSPPFTTDPATAPPPGTTATGLPAPPRQCRAGDRRRPVWRRGGGHRPRGGSAPGGPAGHSRHHPHHSRSAQRLDPAGSAQRAPEHGAYAAQHASHRDGASGSQDGTRRRAVRSETCWPKVGRPASIRACAVSGAGRAPPRSLCR